MNIKEIKKHQHQFLAKEKKRRKSKVYTINGIKITVNPGVFPPATDTKLLAKNILTSASERVLDITAGSGVFSVIAGLQGASGIAVDINPLAVKNTQENIKRYGVKFIVMQSNLYGKLHFEKFDQIFANGPFSEGKIRHILDRACFGAQNFINELLKDLKIYLKPAGKLLIVLPSWFDLKKFRKTVKENKLKINLIATKKSEDGERTYNLYEIIIPI